MEKILTIPYEHYDSVEDMPQSDRALILAATSATAKAYAPYSHFRVGAAARLADGRILSAANCESEVFPSGMCAERALLHFLATNYGDLEIKEFAIASDPSERECYPCGSCRQALLDAQRRQGNPIRLIFSGGGGATTIQSAELLLPFSFKL